MGESWVQGKARPFCHDQRRKKRVLTAKFWPAEKIALAVIDVIFQKVDQGGVVLDLFDDQVDPVPEEGVANAFDGVRVALLAFLRKKRTDVDLGEFESPRVQLVHAGIN